MYVCIDPLPYPVPSWSSFFSPLIPSGQAAMTLRPASSVLEHRHTLLEGNTVLNLAARCGCLKVHTAVWSGLHT